MMCILPMQPKLQCIGGGDPTQYVIQPLIVGLHGVFMTSLCVPAIITSLSMTHFVIIRLMMQT